jgi:hypothetical protein
MCSDLSAHVTEKLSHIKGHTVLLQGRAPSLVNLKVRGGQQIVNGESDTEGVFRISVELNPQDKEATLFVESENGTYESAPVHLIVDNEAPTIETITFDPTEGKAGGKARIFVKSEPELGTVIATIDGTQIPLSESGAQIDHVYMFTPETLSLMCKKAGFVIVYMDVDEGKKQEQIKKQKQDGLNTHHIRLVARKDTLSKDIEIPKNIYLKARISLSPVLVKIIYIIKYSNRFAFLRKILHIS